jgi:hypothetical protein
MCTYANIPKYIPIIPIFPDVNIYIYLFMHYPNYPYIVYIGFLKWGYPQIIQVIRPF